jgi:hypothetical protein
MQYTRVPMARLATPAFIPGVIVKTYICDRGMQKSRSKPVFATESPTPSSLNKIPTV